VITRIQIRILVLVSIENVIISCRSDISTLQLQGWILFLASIENVIISCRSDISTLQLHSWILMLVSVESKYYVEDLHSAATGLEFSSCLDRECDYIL
jgi:hypothetical protein